MTQKQQSDLERAIERATDHAIIVIAQGRMKQDNSRFYLTNSHSTPGGVHVVRQYGQRLSCDCAASQHGKICSHRAATYMHLQVAAARRQAQADAIEQALEAETAIATPATDTAIKAATKTTTQPVGWTAPMVRDNRPLSIWK